MTHLNPSDLRLIRAAAWAADYETQQVALVLIDAYEATQKANDEHEARLTAMALAYDALNDVFDKGRTLTEAREIVKKVRADFKKSGDL